MTRHPYNNRRYLAERRAALKAAGLCQWCGYHPAKPSKRSVTGIGCRCEDCAAKANKRARRILARLRPAWIALGICVTCGKREAVPRRRLCGACADRQGETKTRAKERRAT